MSKRPDEFVLAMAQLGRLFARADRLGRYPHELDPATFYEAWAVLNRQPLRVREAAHEMLVSKLTHPRLRVHRGQKDAKSRPQ